MKHPREYEVKLSLAPGDVDNLMAHPLLAGARARSHVDHLTATYFDTPDAALRRRRISLRVRHAESGTTQTLKTADGSRVDRAEWETKAPRDATRPDRAWLRRTPLQRRFLKHKTFRLMRPWCTMTVTRTRFPVAFEGAAIEAAIDLGSIRAAGQTVSVHELELELKAGASRRVDALARQLAADLPLTLCLTSKAERAFQAAAGTADKPTKALDLTISRDMTMAQAFEAITQSCLHALLFNAALIAGPERAEATHKARIALRRLRATLKLFRPALRRGKLAIITASVKWLSDNLGDARDADVFQSGTFDRAARESRIAGAQALAQAMRETQAVAHARLDTALASPRWRTLLLDLLAFSTSGLRHKIRAKRFRPFARRRLARASRALVHKAGVIRAKTPETRHAVRKRAKMLRYDLDLFADDPRFTGRRNAYRRTAKALAVLQETLGSLHDEEAVRERLRALRGSCEGAGASCLSSEARAAAETLAARPLDGEAMLAKADKAIRRLARASG